MTEFLASKSRTRYGEELFIGGQRVPGVATVKVGQSRDIQRDRPKKGGGARLTDNGFPGGDVSISILMWDESHREVFYDQLLPIFSPRRKDKGTDPIAAEHWQLRKYGIDALVITDVDDPGPDERGVQTIGLKCFEWVPSPKAQKGGAGSKPKGKETGKDEATAEGDLNEFNERDHAPEPADEADEDTGALADFNDFIDEL